MPTKRTPGAKPAPASDKATPGGVAERGRRFSRVKVFGDSRSAVEIISDDSHHLLNPERLKAWAAGVLRTAGVELAAFEVEHEFQNEGALIREHVACTVLKPLKLEETLRADGGFLGYRIVGGGGFEHDDMPMLAARIYELAREVELAKADPSSSAREFYAMRAAQVGYELGRLTMLAKVYTAEAEAGKKGGRPAAATPTEARKVFERLKRAGVHAPVSKGAAQLGIGTRRFRDLLKAPED